MIWHSGDSFLAWASSERHGSIARLRNKLLWLARVNDIPLTMDESGKWVRLMAALGHLEVNWKAGQWAIVPPTVTMLPLADGTAFLTGALSSKVTEHPDIEPVLHTRSRAGHSVSRLLPQMRVLQVDDLAEMQQICAEVGAQWADYGAAHLCNSLGELELTSRAASPARDAPLEFLQVALPRQWRQASSYEAERSPGLYRTTVGQPRYYYRSNGSWWHTELAEGVALQLKRSGEQFLSWCPEVHGRQDAGTLFVNSRALLPALHERAAVLCSGLTAKNSAGFAEYRNVPRRMATAIASALSQDLRIERPTPGKIHANV